MLVSTNPAGYKFVWPAGSPYIEVFRKTDSIDAPFEVIDGSEMNYSTGALNVIANESAEYSR